MDLETRIRTLANAGLDRLAIAAILDTEIADVQNVLEGDDFELPVGVSSAVYTASLSNIPWDSEDDPVIEWSAAPTYDLTTFGLTADQQMLVLRGGIYRITVFGEISGAIPAEDRWDIFVDDGAFAGPPVLDYVSTYHMTFAGFNGDEKEQPSMHSDLIFACDDSVVVPWTLDLGGSQNLSANLKAFPQRLGDAPDFSGDLYLPYYLPAA